MERDIKQWGQELFDSIKQTAEDGSEYWSARDLAEALEYTWEGFESVVTRAQVATKEVGLDVDNHFRHVSIMASIGYGNERPVDDVRLTRYACYIVAQNGNAAKKPKIAAAQAYFAVQTRTSEIRAQIDSDYERLIARQKFSDSDKSISGAVMAKDMSPRGLASIKSGGDTKLFGGKTTRQMKAVYGITKPNTPLANRMPNVVLAAKTLANEMTTSNLETQPIDTYTEILEENNANNAEVRKTLLERGITPEQLPAAEDTEVIRRRLQIEDKRAAIED